MQAAFGLRTLFFSFLSLLGKVTPQDQHEGPVGKTSPLKEVTTPWVRDAYADCKQNQLSSNSGARCTNYYDVYL